MLIKIRLMLLLILTSSFSLIQSDPNISPSSSSNVKGSARKETIGCDASGTQPSHQESGTGNTFTPVEKFECKIYIECVF